MSGFGIKGVGYPDAHLTGTADPVISKASTKTDAKTHAMAQEFEAMFVRQILNNAKLGGSKQGQSSGGYGTMGVDALASQISKTGGLGLAKQIEDAVRTAESAIEPGSSGT